MPEQKATKEEVEGIATRMGSERNWKVFCIIDNPGEWYIRFQTSHGEFPDLCIEKGTQAEVEQWIMGGLPKA